MLTLSMSKKNKKTFNLKTITIDMYKYIYIL